MWEQTAGDMAVAFVLLSLIALATAPGTERIDAAATGLQRYFSTPNGYLNSCGATGGVGGGSRWECICETTQPPFCRNCWRWWMAGALQALVDLNNATSHHPSRNATAALLEKTWTSSPFTTRAYPTWAYVDDYLWYTLLWLRVHQTSGDGRYLQEATATFDQMARWGMDEPCGGIFWMYPDNDKDGARKNAVTTLEAVSAAAQLALAHRAADPGKAAGYEAQAHRLWAWLQSTPLLSTAPLVQDNVSDAAGGGRLQCCNGSASGTSIIYGHSGRCAVNQGTTTWTYNQGGHAARHPTLTLAAPPCPRYHPLPLDTSPPPPSRPPPRQACCLVPRRTCTRSRATRPTSRSPHACSTPPRAA